MFVDFDGWWHSAGRQRASLEQVRTKWLSFFFFFFFLLALHKHTMVTHRFTMTITPAQRNHGNIELINSRTEELLVPIVHAASLYVRVKLTLSLQRFVSDVLGYINLLTSYGLPLCPYPTITNPSLVHGCVRACVCVPARVDIFPAFPRERRQRQSEKYSHVLSGDLRSAMFAPLFPFSFNTSSKKKFSPFSTPFAFFFSFLVSYCVR